MQAHEVISQLALKPHPEGGWYREFYRSAIRVGTAAGERSAITSIYFLLERHQVSRWHVIESDELWHFGRGAPLELFAYDPSASQLTRYVLSNSTGSSAVAVIPGGIWQAARSVGDYSLVGCTVGPGFEFAQFRFVSELPGHTRHFEHSLKPLATLL